MLERGRVAFGWALVVLGCIAAPSTVLSAMLQAGSGWVRRVVRRE